MSIEFHRNENGQFHRIDGPAVIQNIWFGFSEKFYINGELQKIVFRSETQIFREIFYSPTSIRTVNHAPIPVPRLTQEEREYITRSNRQRARDDIREMMMRMIPVNREPRPFPIAPEIYSSQIWLQTHEEVLECGISRQEVPENEHFYTLNCGHSFGQGIVDWWNAGREMSHACPLCRADIVPRVIPRLE